MCKVDTKLLIKLIDSSMATDQNPKWVHLCYVDSDIYKEFLQSPKGATTINEMIIDWCKSDFNQAIDMATTSDLEILKGLVKKYYSELYPDLYRESEIDRQGWIRIWVTSHLKQEVENGKISQ